MNPSIPGYYVITLIRIDQWPYITTVIQGGPYADPPSQVNPDEKVRYWNGSTWRRAAIARPTT